MEKSFEAHFFVFDTLDREIDKKLKSKRANPPELFAVLRENLPAMGFAPEAAGKIAELFENKLSRLNYRHQNPNYLTHPIRVAAAYLHHLKQPSYEQAVLALAHNLNEVAPGMIAGIEERLLPRAVQDQIAALTVDRVRQNDPQYLNAYFDSIAAMGPHAMLLKGLDKLDNALGCLFLECVAEYMEINTRYLCPRLEKFYPDLARYLAEVSLYIQKPETRKRFCEFDPAKSKALSQ